MNKKKQKRKSILNSALLVLLVVSGIFTFAFNMFSPIFAIFVEKIGGSLTTASNASAIFLAVSGILTFIASKYENKMKEKELAIIWSQVILGLGYLLYFFCNGEAMLYLIQIILGIAEALYWPAFHALYAAHTDSSKSFTQWGVYDGLAYIFPSIGAALGGWLVAAYGFGSIFLVMAVLSFLNAFFILFLPRKIL